MQIRLTSGTVFLLAALFAAGAAAQQRIEFQRQKFDRSRFERAGQSAEPAPAPAAPAADETLDVLKRQMAEMQAQIEKLAKR